MLRWALAHPYRVLATAGVIFVASLFSVTIIGTEFMPAEDHGDFNVMVEFPPGVSFDEAVARIGGVEQAVLAVPEVRQVFSNLGLNGDPRKSQIQVKTTARNERARGLEAIKSKLRATLGAIPFVSVRVSDPEFMQGSPVQQPINVYVRGNDMAELRGISGELVQRITRIPGAVEVSSTLVSGQPEMVARVDRGRAADMGLSVSTLLDGVVFNETDGPPRQSGRRRGAQFERLPWRGLHLAA